MSEHLDDNQLLLGFCKELGPPSPDYKIALNPDDEFEKISENYSEMSSVIRVTHSHSSSSPEKSRSVSKEKKRHWKNCCVECTRLDKGSGKPKTCVCIVPASQRRIQLQENGCLTCRCKGCSDEDYEYGKKKSRKRRSSIDSISDFKIMNGCCKRCMKAFSNKGKEAKSCLCQVPKSVRKKALPPQGCQYCNCHGCNPEDNIRRPSPPVIESNINNFQNSPFYQWMIDQKIHPSQIGIGIPQRTYSYIYGREKE